MSVVVALCTVPDEASATRIARALVEERLAACVNRLEGLTSTYRWRGEVCVETECLLIIKTTSSRFAALRQRIVELHPYEVPELIATEVTQGLDRYLAWVAEQTAV
jgi:periplasmic divalent cation tolerance protein